ncbi:acyl-CoA thioesterase [Poriferisphaera sp. WC338]|uniref:acyl-CoA thioesterase n=1 Tax=Poriferisphaera sp. WC338 TaxID=3425129 RepID=UPI003D81B26E
MAFVHKTKIRVRYGETDQMMTFRNSAALEWFEVGRTESMRAMGLPYTEMESRGVMLPVAESRVFYRGRAVYDDELTVTTTIEMEGKARLRCAVAITKGDGSVVADGYTVHAVVNGEGKPMRPPAWFIELFNGCEG